SVRAERMLLAGVPVEEGVDLVVVDAGESAAGEWREHVRVHPRARPGATLPALRDVCGGSAAACLVGAGRLGSVRRLAPAPPARVVEGHPDRDREAAVAPRAGLRRAPERARRGVGVLVVLRGAV